MSSWDRSETATASRPHAGPAAGLELLINTTVRLDGRVGGAPAGRKVLTLMNTFLRSSSFGHVRQLEAVNDLARQRACAAGTAPGVLTRLDVRYTMAIRTTVSAVHATIAGSPRRLGSRSPPPKHASPLRGGLGELGGIPDRDPGAQRDAFDNSPRRSRHRPPDRCGRACRRTGPAPPTRPAPGLLRHATDRRNPLTPPRPQPPSPADHQSRVGGSSLRSGGKPWSLLGKLSRSRSRRGHRATETRRPHTSRMRSHLSARRRFL
jgi:hypothetical protein